MDHRSGLEPGRLTDFGIVGRGAAMEKKLCIASMVVAGLLLVAFLLDLVIGLPFGGSPTFLVIDIVGVLVGGMLIYLGWNALRDLL
jgi:hypothetical protein